jgi:23S rRNA (pseudouridine1915-N3)-methyltransferase
MKLIIVAVGHRMPGWVQTAWDDYAKRLPPGCALELREIKPEPRTCGKTPAQMMAAEARRIDGAIGPQPLRIALDERGRDLTTRELSTQLEQWRQYGRDIALIVGGTDGLDPEFKSNCINLLRLSSLTLPHPMVRVLLAEQLYRAWAISTNHPYHRD